MGRCDNGCLRSDANSHLFFVARFRRYSAFLVGVLRVRPAFRGVYQMRVFNFSAGPAAMPEEVLRQAADEMLDWHGSGMSVMEMSHRGKEFISIADKAEADLRALLAIPANYKVLFLQGGAVAENAIVPMNLLG